ncbi:squalene/phytoene synthase family protein [Sphingomonas sp. PB2P19]|uniref:squalene/phytoene synthase family protein n=1 Tax=Sphingomonas rhamnosi TaxID=3096156 RepID=UPI002FCAA67A
MTDTNPRRAGAAEVSLAVGYAPAPARAALTALLALDATLGGIVRATREPIIGQMRLTWWHDALTKLDVAPPPAEPVLQALATLVVPSVGGAVLANMIDGWEALLEPELDDEAIALFAAGRGEGLFHAMAMICGVSDPQIALAGRGWALADLSQRVRDPKLAGMIRQSAIAALNDAMTGVWPRGARALGALALLARADLRGEAPGSPKRIGRILIHRLTGR